MRDWLDETHGPTFELLRHFLLRFFDSDLVTSPGQTVLALIGASSMFVSWFPFVTGPLKDKYAHFSALPTPDPYRLAIRGDHLWLMVMLMAAIGLLTAVKWQSLFPSMADYRAIGWMPVRSWQVFAAKLAAVLLVATGAVIVLNLLPCAGFPGLSGGRWAFEQSMGRRMVALGAATVAGSYFTFFALVGVQGVLLNLLSARRFARVAAWSQGVLAGAMLILLVLSFSIGPPLARAVVRPDVARWLPPVWFLGLCQFLSGDADPQMAALAHWAVRGLGVAIAVVLGVYLVSYRRHRALMMEGTAAIKKDVRWFAAIFDRMVSDPQEQAVIVFLAKGIWSNGPHRMILMGYGAFGFAVLLSGTIGIAGMVGPDRVAAARFVYAHVILLTFLLIGVRHLFSIPVELRANWVFRIAEREGRRRWLRAMDRFVLFFGGVAAVLLPFPLEVWLVGWRAVSEAALIAVFGLACYEVLFASWEKLPFTCSYLPGQKPMWMVALRLFALLAALPMVNAILLACLYNWVLFGVVFAALLAVGIRFHRSRREAWGEVRLRYEESPDPAVHTLNLRG
jgi:hypothetical protein